MMFGGCENEALDALTPFPLSKLSCLLQASYKLAAVNLR